MNITKSIIFITIFQMFFSCSENNDNQVEPPSSIKLNITELSIQLNDTETLKVTSDTRGFDITWQSSDNEVATVNNGIVNAIGIGNCTVTATIEQISTTCNIEVLPNLIELDYDELDLEIGETRSLRITSETGGHEASWSSSNEDVAIVNNGIVEAIAAGICTITATIGSISVSSAIRVLPNSLEIESQEVSLKLGETILVPIITEIGENEVTWSSNDPEVADVDENGLITAKSEGQAIIMVELGELSATCSVNVTGYDIYVVGYEGAEAKLWHNGVETNLTNGANGAQAYAIDIDNEDIYVAGVEFNGSKLVAKVWKNGSAIELTDGSNSAYATDIQVVDGNVYVVGYEYTSSYNSIAKLWVNGEETVLSNPINTALAESIFVSNGDVYVAGYEYEGGKSIAKIWKNGIAINLTDGLDNAEAHGIYIDNEDVYVSGSIGLAAVFWENGIPTYLTNGLSSANAYDIKVKGEDVYTVGNGLYLSSNAIVWKNGNPTELTLNENYNSSDAFALQVLNNNIIVSGFVHRNQGGLDASLWVNGELTVLSSGQSNGVAKDVFVR